MSSSADNDAPDAADALAAVPIVSGEPLEGEGTLVADADSPGTEIVVIDGCSQRVARGVGRLRQTLPAGIYKVVFTTGGMKSDQIVVVHAGKEAKVGVDRKELLFPSAVPLHGTSTSREHHRAAASHLSREKPLTFGKGGGSRLFVFVRALEPLDYHLVDDLTLVDEHDDTVFDFKNAAVADVDEAHSGVNLELAPGCYRLRMTLSSKFSAEQTVITCANWQTQVFLHRRPWKREELEQRWFDLAQISMLMSKPEVGFNPEKQDRLTTSKGEWEEFDQGLRWGEQARRAWADGRLAVADDALESFLYRKFDNPMLGIFGAHLLMRRLDRDRRLEISPRAAADVRSRLHVIAENLRDLLGDHPDVIALYAKCSPTLFNERRIRCIHPPMLRSSWNALIAASAQHPALFSAGTLAARISARTLGVHGAWLLWQPVAGPPPPPPPGAAEKAGELGLGKVREVYRKVATWVGEHVNRSKELAGSTPLLRAEERMLNYLLALAKHETRERFDYADLDADKPSARETSFGFTGKSEHRVEPPAPVKSVADRAVADPYLKVASIVRSLQLPPVVIERSLLSIESRMEAIQTKPPEKWPPTDSSEYIHGESFGRLMLDVAKQLMGRYRSMDFTDAVAQVYAWLDGRVEREPDFVSGGRFKSQAAFVAYVKQAMWNAGRLAARKRKRQESLGILSIEDAMDPLDVNAEAAGAMVDQLDQLPELQHKVLYHYLLKEKTVEQVAATLGLSLKMTVALYEKALSAVIPDGPAALRAPKKTAAGRSKPGSKNGSPSAVKKAGAKKVVPQQGGPQKAGSQAGVPQKAIAKKQIAKKPFPKKPGSQVMRGIKQGAKRSAPSLRTAKGRNSKGSR
jgi:hypothetical protein